MRSDFQSCFKQKSRDNSKDHLGSHKKEVTMQKYDTEIENARLLGMLTRVTGLEYRELSGGGEYSLTIDYGTAKEVLNAFFPNKDTIDINTMVYDYSVSRPFPYIIKFQYEGALWRLDFSNAKTRVFDHFNIQPCEECHIFLEATHDRKSGMYLCTSCLNLIAEDETEKRIANADFEKGRA